MGPIRLLHSLMAFSLARIRDVRFFIQSTTHLGQNKRLARPAGHVLYKALVEELASVLGVERLRLLLAKGDQGAEEKNRQVQTSCPRQEVETCARPRTCSPRWRASQRPGALGAKPGRASAPLGSEISSCLGARASETCKTSSVFDNWELHFSSWKAWCQSGRPGCPPLGLASLCDVVRPPLP